MSEMIRATYLIETPFPVEQAAEALAGEQSSGTFLPIPGETEELQARFRAKVEKITLLETRDAPSLPGVRLPKGWIGPPRYQSPETFRLTQTTDVMYLAGGGVMAHPGGPGAGLIAIRQAWEAAVAGIPLDEYAGECSELQQALEKYGA